MTLVPLRVRSHGSLLYGTRSPEALIDRALELGYAALALTDRDNLYLAIRFYQAARAGGLAPLLGAELTCGRETVLLLALDRRGFAHLCEILTARHLDGAFDPAGAIAARHSGLHVIAESTGMLATLAHAGVPPAAGSDHSRPRAREGGLWLGVRGLPRERPDLARRLAAARALGVPAVATGDVVMLAPAEHETHRVAVTAEAGELIDRMPPDAFAAREAWLAAPAEWTRRVRTLCAGASVPEAAAALLANNTALAARCRLALDLGEPIFPEPPLPPGVAGAAHLAAECAAGLARRYPPPRRPRAARRLEHELGIIDRMGFTGYFLLVAEIVGFARARGIPTVGRGSGASSIVSYVLGITNVDPIRHGLYFERFLHPARRDCPDLDIDLCWKRRDEVIAHVYQTYGDDRVAMISTHSTLGARSAFRETAKALGIPNPRVNALARRVPHDLEPPYRERLRGHPAAAGPALRAGAPDWSEPVLARALEMAEALGGAPRHLSIHSGGVVIADRPLTHYVPLERSAKGVVVTQFEMRAIEAIGLVKMDLLGNRALSTLDTCVRLARGRGAEVALDDIPAADEVTGSRLAAGDALNCFQLESPAMRHLLRMLRCRTLEETIAAVALVRPGAAESGMKEAFCRRHRGLEPAEFRHPRARRVLAATHGVMLYEEDVMCVASAVAGLSLAEGDDLRRALGKARGDGEFRALERGFALQCGRAGVDAESAGAVWRDLTRFAGYAFCKAHAAGYGTLGWQSAWLKARYPSEHAVGILDHHAGMYATWVHVEDLRRHGVTFLAPCVLRSEWDARLEERGGGAGAGGGAVAAAGSPAATAVRVGLSRVFGLSATTGERIAAERPFASLADFCDRVRPTLPELEALVRCGAFDWTGRTRPSLLLEARVGGPPLARGSVVSGRRAPALAGAGVSLLPAAVAPLAVPELPEFDAAARVRGEIESTGLWFSGHPLDLLVEPEALAGTTPAAALERNVGRRIEVVGMPCASRRVETRGGGVMLFLTLADHTGLAECVLFPDAYRALARRMRGEVVRVAGRVDDSLGALTVVAERASSFGAGAADEEGGAARGRGMPAAAAGTPGAA